MLLCLSDANQQTDSSKPKKNQTGIQILRLLMEMRN